MKSVKDLCLFVLTALLLSCSLFSEKEDSALIEAPQIQAPDLGVGIGYLENEQYERAEGFFQDFLDKKPVSPWTNAAVFFLGLSQLEQGKFPEATKKLEAVVRLSEKSDPALEAEALFYLARAQEGAGEDAKALASYLDANRRSKYLKQELSLVEIPARIAGVYARQNQMTVADRYYAKADSGLTSLQNKARYSSNAWMAKSFYSMGKTSPRQILTSDFDSKLKSFKRAQNYLVRSIEVNHIVWSKKALNEIEYVYESAWKVIQSVPLEEGEDRLAALKTQQERMIELALQLNGMVELLKQEIIPGEEDKNPFLAQMSDFAKKMEARLDTLISSRAVNEGLTPEAQKLEGDFREGKVIDQKGVLEKPAKLPAKKSEKK